MLRALTIVVFLGCALAGASSARAEVAPEAVRDATQHVLDRGEYQREMPADRPDVPTDSSARAAPQRIREETAEDHGTSTVFGVLLWVATGVGVLLAVVWIGMQLMGYEPDSTADDGAGEGDGAAEPDKKAFAARVLEDAEALAAASRWGDAIHALLLRTFAELAHKLPEPLSPSLTSREILARVPVLPEARGALGQLVSAVEVSHFGAETPGEADYQRCLASFRRFAAVLS